MLFIFLNNNISATQNSNFSLELSVTDELEDSVVEEVKKNIIKRYFEKRAQKKADIKDGLIALEEKRLRELLRKKIKPSDTLYNGAPQYQFHKSDLDFYISNFRFRN